MKTSSYDPEKGFATSFDYIEPLPGTAGGVYVSTGGDEDGGEEEEEESAPAVVRAIEFKSASDSNVKFKQTFNADTGILTVEIGVYYV